MPFKPGQSGNPAGKKPHTPGQFRKTKAALDAAHDIKKSKRFYRAIINNDAKALEEFGITSVTVANQMEAQKQLNILAKAELEASAALEAAFIAEQKANSKKAGATFQTSSTVTPIAKAV